MFTLFVTCRPISHKYTKAVLGMGFFCPNSLLIIHVMCRLLSCLSTVFLCTTDHFPYRHSSMSWRQTIQRCLSCSSLASPLQPSCRHNIFQFTHSHHSTVCGTRIWVRTLKRYLCELVSLKAPSLVFLICPRSLHHSSIQPQLCTISCDFYEMMPSTFNTINYTWYTVFIGFTLLRVAQAVNLRV